MCDFPDPREIYGLTCVFGTEVFVPHRGLPCNLAARHEYAKIVKAFSSINIMNDESHVNDPEALLDAAYDGNYDLAKKQFGEI
jgi:hypothetical protein